MSTKPADESAPKNVLSVRCPRCDADPGRKCRGAPMPHGVRVVRRAHDERRAAVGQGQR